MDCSWGLLASGAWVQHKVPFKRATYVIACGSKGKETEYGKEKEKGKMKTILEHHWTNFGAIYWLSWHTLGHLGSFGLSWDLVGPV